MRKNCRDRATWHRCVWDSARRRARAKGIEFGLTEADIIAMAEDADHRCAVSGIPFDYSPLLRGDQYSRRPFFPSLDRIVPKGPYTRENVRLVLVAMNIALSDWGEDVFRLLAIGYLDTVGIGTWQWTKRRGCNKSLRGVKRLRGTRTRPYEARITHRGRSYHLGCHATEREAHRVYMLAQSRIRAGLPVKEDDGNDREEGQRAVQGSDPA